MVFEGSKEQVSREQTLVYKLAKKHHGIKADEANGRRGYFLTYMIAYLRDFGMSFGYVGESFETSVPWTNTLMLCNKTKNRIRRECKKRGIKEDPLVSCRVTQTYDAGSCVYFYFGFKGATFKDPCHVFAEIENAARETILKCGGSVSHHHGIGKHRSQFMEQTVSPVGIQMLKGLKKTLDPKNIFANGNLLPTHE
mmetsp:Transcript_19521/g.21709  ORF Transcript_19521/g.21709 Transcript_19521/m.21709 type:complete len:196 (+) Transcript_19521:1-588(+)